MLLLLRCRPTASFTSPTFREVLWHGVLIGHVEVGEGLVQVQAGLLAPGGGAKDADHRNLGNSGACMSRELKVRLPAMTSITLPRSNPASITSESDEL